VVRCISAGCDLCGGGIDPLEDSEHGLLAGDGIALGNIQQALERADLGREHPHRRFQPFGLDVVEVRGVGVLADRSRGRVAALSRKHRQGEGEDEEPTRHERPDPSTAVEAGAPEPAPALGFHVHRPQSPLVVRTRPSIL
jgi:hypothetical protein